MSASTVVIVILAALLAVLALFIVALLRSHAEILRRLAALEGDAPAVAAADGAAGPPPAPAGPARAPADLAGETLAGDAVKLSLGPGSPRTLLAFLSSGCASCGPLWAGLHGEPPAPPGTRLVVVTKGADRESPSRLAELAPADREVVMSNRAWEDFAVPATPYFVLLESDGGLAGRGSAGSWEQILTLLADAAADSRRAGGGARGASARAARAEAALAAAGVGDGHPSLYPSRTSVAPDEFTGA